MNTHEVAQYLRIKERKVYDLVRQKQIPCTRASGKWLFPKHLIDRWLSEGLQDDTGIESERSIAPPVIAGSHDPLLEWALLESGCGLAMLGGGSLDGLKRFASGEALACGLHILDARSGDYNIPVLKETFDGKAADDLVLIEWARRHQGLVLAPGNPLNIQNFEDLISRKAQVVLRQPDAGSRILFEHLMGEAKREHNDFTITEQPARNETELGLAIRDGKADAGLAIAAAARQYELDFLPLCFERFDVLIRRRDYFEQPFQTLLKLAHSEAFARRAEEMTGYDISGLGCVHFNG